MPAVPHSFRRVTLAALPSAPALAWAVGAGGAAVLAFGACATLSPRWLAGIAIALSLFFALKILTLVGHARHAHAPRLLAYVSLWPGMNAETFLRRSPPHPASPTATELLFALGKVAFGVTLMAWATAHVFTADRFVLGLVGLGGLIFFFHFGIFHVASWVWRRAGVNAPLLMRAPIGARSLADFWGARWNTAFSELARRFVLRPLSRRYGTVRASVAVFLVSGFVHEIAISVPAGGGWGGPTLYFLVQGLGLAVEKSPAGRCLGLGAGLRGWGWTFLITALPAPLLFHPPFLDRVVIPFFRFFKEVL